MKEHEIGDVMPDGTIFACISPDTGGPCYVPAADEPLVMRWRKAMRGASRKGDHGHKDWRLPSRAELNAIFENREKGALKGTFNHKVYWSSVKSGNIFLPPYHQDFENGGRGTSYELWRAGVRCVRTPNSIF